ncbi:hypothetical protein BJN34_14410 [Cupriavidus necator]|uniref:Uncharacterized protein n=2 Tax=Cupriavidus necator TaxID=106590 RepID=A0A1U9UR16_CUPNE|nr:hypothetical protein BJN34_14410 [Cupriavidus necator]
MLQNEELNSALVMDYTVADPVYRHSDTDAPQPFSQSDFQKNEELFNDTAWVLTVVGPRVVIPVCKWLSYDDPDLECAIGGAHRRSRIHEILPLRVPARSHKKRMLQSELLTGFFPFRTRHAKPHELH